MENSYMNWEDVNFDKIFLEDPIDEGTKMIIKYIDDNGVSVPLKIKIPNLETKYGLAVSTFKFGELELQANLDESDKRHIEIFGNHRFSDQAVKPGSPNKGSTGFYRRLRLRMCELMSKNDKTPYPDDEETQMPMSIEKAEKTKMWPALACNPSDAKVAKDKTLKSVPKKYSKKYKGGYYLKDAELRKEIKAGTKSKPAPPERGIIPEGIIFSRPSIFEIKNSGLVQRKIEDILGMSMNFDIGIHFDSVGYHMEKFSLQEKVEFIVIRSARQRTAGVDISAIYSQEEIMAMEREKGAQALSEMNKNITENFCTDKPTVPDDLGLNDD